MKIGTDGEDDDGQRRTRPSHFRSRSYLSGLTTPVEIKPRNASTMPMDGEQDTVGKVISQTDDTSSTSILPRIHLPGHRHRQSQDLMNAAPKEHHIHVLNRSHSHRYTKSEAYRDGARHEEGLLQPTNRVINKMTAIASRNGQQKPHHQHSASDFHKSWSGSTRPGLRRRATSDSKGPTTSYTGAQAQFGFLNDHGEQTSASEVDVLLLKAEKNRALERNVTDEDVNRLSIQLAESNVELQDQLQSITKSYTSLMRRLDDAYFSLSSTKHSLIDTISSFQNLNQQSGALAENFDRKSQELDREIRSNLDKHRAALFDARGAHITKLEERSRYANERAEQMSSRLENCRTIVRNYTERQQTKQRAWKGVLLGSLWGTAAILLSILLGLGIWWMKTYGVIVEYDIRQAASIVIEAGGLRGHGQIHDLVKSRAKEINLDPDIPSKLPTDVKKILDDIATRHNSSNSSRSSSATTISATSIDDSLEKIFHKVDL